MQECDSGRDMFAFCTVQFIGVMFMIFIHSVLSTEAI